MSNFARIFILLLIVIPGISISYEAKADVTIGTMAGDKLDQLSEAVAYYVGKFQTDCSAAVGTLGSVDYVINYGVLTVNNTSQETSLTFSPSVGQTCTVPGNTCSVSSLAGPYNVRVSGGAAEEPNVVITSGTINYTASPGVGCSLVPQCTNEFNTLKTNIQTAWSDAGVSPMPEGAMVSGMTKNCTDNPNPDDGDGGGDGGGSGVGSGYGGADYQIVNLPSDDPKRDYKDYD